MLIVVFGQMKWYCACVDRASRDVRCLAVPGQRRFADLADLARVGGADGEQVRVGIDIDHLRESGVCGGAVVALEEVLDRDLPVRLDLPLVVRVVANVAEVDAALRDDLRERAERVDERRRLRIRVDEHEWPPGVDRDGKQRQPGRVEALLALGPRRASQRAVQVVRPGVVRALERLSPALAAHHRMAAMPADVDEPLELLRAVAENDDGDVAGPACEESSGLLHLVGAARVLPGSGEDPVALEPPDALVRVPARRKRPPLLDGIRDRGDRRTGCVGVRLLPHSVPPGTSTDRTVRITAWAPMGEDTNL